MGSCDIGRADISVAVSAAMPATLSVQAALLFDIHVIYALSNPRCQNSSVKVVARHSFLCTWHILNLDQHDANKPSESGEGTNLKTIYRITTSSSLVAILVCVRNHRRRLLFYTPSVCVLNGDIRVINNLIIRAI
jgi:hypothetical protein